MAGKMALRKRICFACSEQFPEVPCEPIECPIIQVIKDIDTESLRPKGRWEKHMEFDFKACRDFQAGFHCSCCGVWKLNIDNLKYCPNCGAKMEGAKK